MTEKKGVIIFTDKDGNVREVKRQPAERWSRVMGYHRPVDGWNVGKRGEWEERTPFKERANMIDSIPPKDPSA